jgi:hypothetical protein
MLCDDPYYTINPAADRPRLRITVPPPWGLSGIVSCEPQACGIFESEAIAGPGGIAIAATVADAGPVNVLFEVVDEEATCP